MTVRPAPLDALREMAEKLKARRDALWSYNRTPEGKDERERYDTSHLLNDAVNAIGAALTSAASPLRSEDDWQTLQAAIVTQSDLIKRLTSAASGPQQETGPQEWQAAFERLGHVLNIEAREHGEIVKALEVEYDMGSMESDETFHARVLDRIAQLRAASLGVSPTAEKGKELARVREKIMGVVCLSEGADIKNVSLNFSTDEWRQLSAALTSAASRPTS